MRGPWGRGACPIAGTSGSFCGQCSPSQTGEKKKDLGSSPLPAAFSIGCDFLELLWGLCSCFVALAKTCNSNICSPMLFFHYQFIIIFVLRVFT